MRDCYYDRKKRSSNHLSGGWAIVITMEKKILVVYLAGAQSLLRPEKKSSIRLSGGCAIAITTGNKKVLVVCLAGALSLLRPEKKNSSRLSSGCAIVITTGKKSSSHLWRVRDHYYDRKKKVLVVCLAGGQSLLRPEKK